MDTKWTCKTTYLGLLWIALESQKIPYLRHFWAISNESQEGTSVDTQLSDTFLRCFVLKCQFSLILSAFPALYQDKESSANQCQMDI